MKNFSLILLILMSMVLTSKVNAQIPPVSAPACSFCGGKNGEHATSCRYYVPPKTNLANPSQNAPDAQQQLNSLIDSFNTPSIDTKTTNEIEEEKARLAEKRAKEERIQFERNESIKKELKPIEANPVKIATKRNATIQKCLGSNIEIKRNNGWQKIDCSNINNVSIAPNETVRLGDNSKLTLLMSDSMLVQLSPNTEFNLSDPDKSYLELLYGKLRFFCKKSHAKFAIHTITAICGVRGTQFEMIVNRDGGWELSLYEGEIEIENKELKERILLLSPGKKVKITADGRVDTVEKIDINDFIEAFEK